VPRRPATAEQRDELAPFNHLVGNGEHARRHCDAERFGGFEIDHSHVLVMQCRRGAPVT